MPAQLTPVYAGLLHHNVRCLTYISCAVQHSHFYFKDRSNHLNYTIIIISNTKWISTYPAILDDWTESVLLPGLLEGIADCLCLWLSVFDDLDCVLW